MFIGVATHRLSSVSLFASLTNRTRCTRCAWSTRWSSRTGVTAITLQEANKWVGQITGSVKQTRLLVFDYWCGSNLDSSSTVSSRRTVRSRVSLSHDNTTSGIISLHLPPAQMSCRIRTPRNHTSTNTTNVYTMQITAYFESTPSPRLSMPHLSTGLSSRTGQTGRSDRSRGSTVSTATRSSLFPRLTLEQDRRPSHQM